MRRLHKRLLGGERLRVRKLAELGFHVHPTHGDEPRGTRVVPRHAVHRETAFLH